MRSFRLLAIGTVAALLIALVAGLAVRSIAPASVAAGITPVCPPGAQLVRNGSFEDDDLATNQFDFQPSGWSGTGLLVVGTTAPDGDQYFGLGSSVGTVLTQTLGTTGLDGARLTVSYFAAEFGSPVSVSVNGDSQSPQGTSANFVRFSFDTVLSNPAPTSVTLELRAEAAGAYFDAVSITVADCPGNPTATPTTEPTVTATATATTPPTATATAIATTVPTTAPTATTPPTATATATTQPTAGPTMRPTPRPRTTATVPATATSSVPTVRPTARPRG